MHLSVRAHRHVVAAGLEHDDVALKGCLVEKAERSAHAIALDRLRPLQGRPEGGDRAGQRGRVAREVRHDPGRDAEAHDGDLLVRSALRDSVGQRRLHLVHGLFFAHGVAGVDHVDDADGDADVGQLRGLHARDWLAVLLHLVGRRRRRGPDGQHGDVRVGVLQRVDRADHEALVLIGARDARQPREQRDDEDDDSSETEVSEPEGRAHQTAEALRAKTSGWKTSGPRRMPRSASFSANFGRTPVALRWPWKRPCSSTPMP